MNRLRIFSTALTLTCCLLVSSLQTYGQERGIDKVTVTEDGDSIVLYERDFYDFGTPNPGSPDMHEVIPADSPFATEQEIDALRLEAFNRDLKRLRTAVPRMMKMSVPEDIDETHAVGKIPIQEGTTPSGARTYSIPITVAPSIDLAPQIALYYNSQSGQGLFGFGWNISGLSAITIANMTEYYNGSPRPANYKDTDAVYSLDGIQLVSNATPSLRYEFQLETARGHVAVKKHVSNGKITHFTALYPDGTKATFGQDGYTGPLRYTYPVTEIEDMHGNRIVFKYLLYETDGNNYYISSIEYGFDDSGTPAGKIQFSYSPDTFYYPKYFAGIERQFKRVLNSISSYNGTEEICRYTLHHNTINDDLMLTGIACKSDGKQLNPIRFSYGEESSRTPTGNGSADLIRKDQLFLSSYFNTNGDTDIMYRSGKFIEGPVGDGMIALPLFSTYHIIGHKQNWALGKKYDLYGSRYSPNQKILIAPTLSYSTNVQSITAGEGFQYIDAVDTDADGLDEIVKVNFAGINGNNTILNITVYEFDSSRIITLKSTFNVEVQGVVNNGNIAYSPAERIYAFGDYRGDGKALLLTTLYDSDWNENARTSYSALIDINSQVKLSEEHIIGLSRKVNDRCMLSVDIDNDCRTELCCATSSGIDIYNISGHRFTRTRTVSGLTSAIFPPSDDSNRDIFIADMNGDGYPDIIQRSGSSYVAYRYTGNQFVSLNMQLQAPAEEDELMFYDINRDGLADLIHRSGSSLYFFLNKRGRLSLTDKITSSVSMSGKAGFLPCNSMNYNQLTNFVAIDGAYVYTYDFSQNKTRDRLLTTVIDSHGKTTVNDYEDMSSVYVYEVDREREYEAGFTRKSMPIYLLHNTRTYTSSDLKAGNMVTYLFYRYYDAVISLQGLGFCGFGKVTTTDYMTITNKEIVQSITYDPTTFGIIIRTEQALRQEQDSPFSQTTNEYSRLSYTYKKLNPRLISSTENNFLTGVTTHTSYEYSDYDLPSSITVNKTSKLMKSPGIQEATQYTYSNHVSGSLYLLGQVASCTKTRTRPGATQWAERQTYEYDPETKLPVKEIQYAGSTAGIKIQETVWTYDEAGHVTSLKTAKHNSRNFIGDSYTYDDNSRYLLSHTDALGRTVTYADYNKFGKPGRVTDHKGRVTEISYDEWGNEASRTYPDGTVEKTILDWGGLGAFTVTRQITGKPTEIVHYDAADRKLRTGSIRFNGSWLYTDYVYDEKGRLEKVSMPFKGETATLWNTYEYDEFNRKARFTEVSGNVTTWRYDELQETETYNGITKTRTINPDGTTASIKDDGGEVIYVYRSDGQPSRIGRKTKLSTGIRDSLIQAHKNGIGVGIDPPIIIDTSDMNPSDIKEYAPEIIELGYDHIGRRCSIKDPSAGLQTDTEQWTAEGTSSITHNNPNGTIITRRDQFERIVEIERVGEYTTSYTYNDDGLLISETSTNGTSKTFAYDAFDRLTAETETVPDGKWLRKDYTYTEGSRISAIRYTAQSGEITTEVYTYNNGHVTSVSTVDGYTVWAVTEENSLGLTSKAMTGSVERSYSYSESGQITGRSLGDVQRFAYSFSPMTGNLLSRTDRTRNLVEAFGYDSLNRLTDNNGKSISYSDNGNIMTVASVGEFSYSDSNRPYQITGADLTDGAVVLDREQSVSYTCFARPSRLNEGGRSAAFTYNGSNERVKMYVADGAAPVLSRYYIGGQYEIDLTAGKTVERLYLNGNAYSAPMVLVKDGTAGWVPYNIGRDYLGSITHIATADGILIAEYSYDAWGRLRDPETHEIYLPGQEPALFLGRGFTGHEHLPWFGLINMNARLYDPVIGRFLSPDPYIQMPDFTQNFNRYSYCLNNPLILLDETGEFFVIDSFLVGLFTGGWKRAVQMAKNDIKIWQGLFMSDPNKSLGDRIWEVTSRFLWQPIQTIAGFLTAHAFNTFRISGGVESVGHVYGATVVSTANDGWGAVTQGNFIVGDSSLKADPSNALFQHEYGHYIQSQQFGYLYYCKFGIPSAFSKGTHNDHHAEQDANIRSLKYYYENGLYDTLWDKVSTDNEINGFNHSNGYLDNANQVALLNTIKLNWYDFFDPFIISSIVNTTILNKK